MKVELWRLYEPLSSPFFFFSLCPRESSSPPFIWFSWIGPPCLVYPILIASSLVSPNPPPFSPLEVDPTTLLHSCLSRISQGSVPCLSSSLWLSLHLPLRQQSDRPPTYMHVHADVTHTNIYIQGFDVWGEEEIYAVVKSLLLFPTLTEGLASQWCSH